jgi:hypothetical protein
LDTGLVRHGFVREVFLCKIANNAEALLRGDSKRVLYGGLPSVREASSAALDRWVIPRAERDYRYLDWHVSDLLDVIHGRPIRTPVERTSAYGLGN